MGSTVMEYRSVREGREHFKEMLDSASAGVPTTVRRGDSLFAAVDADRMVGYLMAVRPAGVDAVAEDGGWSLFMPGLPIAADGATLDEATDEMVDALRDYAGAWADHLRHAPNHADNWGLVQIVALATDEQLRAWIHQ